MATETFWLSHEIYLAFAQMDVTDVLSVLWKSSCNEHSQMFWNYKDGEKPVVWLHQAPFF